MLLGTQQQIRVLHVDDEPDFADLATTFLEREDDRFTAETATSADEGLEILADRPPDCVVSDYNMPGMDGLEFLQVVREECPDLPFILFTGRGSEAVASDAIAAGVTDYLQKSSGSEQYELLANRIRNAVQARRESERADRQEQLMRLTEFAGDTGGFELDPETGAVTMTDGARRVLHLSEQANPDFEKNIEKYHPDDRDEIRRTIQRAVRTGEQTHGTFRYHHPDAEKQQLLDITYTPVIANGDTKTIRGAIHDITERNDRQQELQRVQQAIDDANVPITLADPSQPDQPLVYVNNAFEEMTGYPPEETLGRNCRFLQGEGTDSEKVAALREAIDNEESISVELRNYRNDDTEFWNRLTVTPIYDDGDELVRYLGTQEDVTERKERERDLRVEQRFIEQALDTLDDVFYVLDTDGSLRRWNEQVSQVTGYADSELAGMQAIELFSRDDRETIADAIETVISGHKSTVEADVLTADGERHPYEFTGAPLTDDDGQTSGLVGIGRDLTDRRRRERRFQALVEESDDIISIVDAEGTYQYQSPSIKHILGYDPKETIGDTAWEYVHPDDRAELIETFERSVTDPDANPVAEYRARHADGSWRWMEARGNNQLETPAVEGYIVNSREITDRKEREQDLNWTQNLMSNMEELAGIGAWEYDSGTETLMLTSEARRIYGFEAGADLTLEKAFEHVHPEDRERLVDRFDACLEVGESYETDVRLTTTEGAQRWVTVRGERIDGSESDAVVRGYIRDITGEKAREQRLIELNRTLQDLWTADTYEEVADTGVRAAKDILDLSASAIHLCEADTMLTPVAQTDELTAIVGEVPPLPVADSIAGRVYQRGEPTVVEDVREEPDVYNRETDLKGHIYIPLGDNGILIAGSEKQAAFEHQDIVVGELLAEHLAVAFDRIDREQAARQRRERLSLFFEESPLGAIEWDDEFRFKRLNAQAEEILGYSEAELRGESWEMIVADEDRDMVGDAVENLLVVDGGTHVLNTNVRKDGETVTCRWHNHAVTDEDGSVRAIFSKFEDITDQEERKRELQETTSQYQTLIDNFPNGAVFLYNTDHQVVRAGGSELSNVGLLPEDVKGTTPHNRYPPEIAEQLVHHIERAFTGDSPAFEEEYEGKQYRVQLVPVRTDDGEITRVMAVSENITERKERRRELERYESLIENLPVGVFRTTMDGEIVDVNEAATDIYDADSRAQLRKMGADELYRDDSERIDLLSQIQATGRVENELVEFETLDGDHRFVRVTLTLSEESEQQYLEGILQDVTDRRELEHEFAQIKTIAESLNDAVYVINDDGQFTYVNEELTELTGYSEGTILGSTPDLIKDEEAIEEAERQLGRLLSDGGPDTVTFETTIQPTDGDPVVCEDHMGVLPYEGDSFNGSIGVLRDITERKRRQQELRRERDRLNEFASVVSHDLRNPLTVANGRLELAQETCESPHLAQAATAIERSQALIEDLLTLAREGEEVSEVESVALTDVAESSWQTVESPSATLEAHATQAIQADESRLKQFFENLYRNAVEHGGDEVTVTVGPMGDGFYVADTGPGIPKGDREKIFEAGYSTSEEGTGFGLRIVKQVAEAHEWDVAVTESEQGGARFEVTGVEFAD